MVLILTTYCRTCGGYVYWAYENGKIHPRSQQGCPSENCNEVHEIIAKEFSPEEVKGSNLPDKVIGWEPSE